MQTNHFFPNNFLVILSFHFTFLDRFLPLGVRRGLDRDPQEGGAPRHGGGAVLQVRQGPARVLQVMLLCSFITF